MILISHQHWRLQGKLLTTLAAKCGRGQEPSIRTQHQARRPKEVVVSSLKQEFGLGLFGFRLIVL